MYTLFKKTILIFAEKILVENKQTWNYQIGVKKFKTKVL